MVEYAVNLDNVFHSLADPTRRDILRRLAQRAMPVGEIAKHYNVTFAAISKHIKVLEGAGFILKQQRGKEHIIHITPQTFQSADAYLRQYQGLWEGRYNRLEKLLKEGEE